MKRRDLPFLPVFLPMLADGRKTETRRCSGLSEVNQNPGKWTSGMDRVDGGNLFYSMSEDRYILCRCPWEVGKVYPPANVRVVGIDPELLQFIDSKSLRAEGVPYLPGHDGPVDMLQRFHFLWDSIHRRDMRNRWERNPWCWVLTLERTSPCE